METSSGEVEGTATKCLLYDYTSTWMFLQSLPPVVVLPFQNIMMSRKDLIILNAEDEEHYEDTIPVHRIIKNYLRRRKKTASIPTIKSPPPRLRHPDTYLNILQGRNEQEGVFFCGYRQHGIRLDLRLHFSDGNEFYCSELLSENTKYDSTILQLLTPFLKRGYYLPCLLQLYNAVSKRLRFQDLIREEEEFYRFYQIQKTPYIVSWIRAFQEGHCDRDRLQYIFARYRQQDYYNPVTG